ncbi:MAG: SpaH/EbpB family LPXTG-anchored major pilin [Actinomycetaceae bacterium]|nr:SpaH/EbpB family LPXTG-anchored major pilin [Actinomycetaceae bacterium]
MNGKNSVLSRVAAGAGALALALAGLVGGATIAQADDTDLFVGPDQPGHLETGSLVIHKYVGAETANLRDGTPQTIEDRDPLGGVEFTIWRLGTKADETAPCVALNLSEKEAWDKVLTPDGFANLTSPEAGGFCKIASSEKKVKTATAKEATVETPEGTAVFDGLELGLYYVQETKAPANIVSKTAPFYVTIPLPHKQKGWLYDVHAYPKNQKADNPTKTINKDKDQPNNGLVVGSVVEWTIEQTVPALNNGETYTSASIWDYLPNELEYVETLEVKHRDTLLHDGTEYNLVKDTTGKNLTWKISEDYLKSLKAGDILSVKFSTKVLEVTTNGDINNPGSTDPEKPGYGSEFNGNELPGEQTPYTYWGQLKVNKVDDSTPAKPLKGAEFKVFNTLADGNCSVDVPTDADPVATGTSNANGVVQWDKMNTETVVETDEVLGLWIANNANGPIEPAPTKTYCLYETVVPAGHSADLNGKPVTISPGTTLTKDVNDLDIKNPKKQGPNLPLTGAGGTFLLSVIGIGLAAGGVTLAAISRRKRQA